MDSRAGSNFLLLSNIAVNIPLLLFRPCNSSTGSLNLSLQNW